MFTYSVDGPLDGRGRLVLHRVRETVFETLPRGFG